MLGYLHDRDEVRELRRAVLAVPAEELKGSVGHEVNLRPHAVVPKGNIPPPQGGKREFWTSGRTIGQRGFYRSDQWGCSKIRTR